MPLIPANLALQQVQAQRLSANGESSTAVPGDGPGSFHAVGDVDEALLVCPPGRAFLESVLIESR